MSSYKRGEMIRRSLAGLGGGMVSAVRVGVIGGTRPSNGAHPIHRFVLSLLLALAPARVVAAEAQSPGTLRVGAVRVNTTPPADAALPMSGYRPRTEGFTAIHDSLYHRVVVLGDGRTLAAIVVADVGSTPNGWWEELTGRIEREAGIPRENVLLAATHTHGAPRPVHTVDEPSETLRAYTRSVSDAVVDGVRRARASARPARMGAGRGRANINTNRVARMGTGGWWLGHNPDGPSDKTVHVVRFEGEDGKPIAILSNYAVHGVVGGPKNYEVTGDLPGSTARAVEARYGDEVVAPWTSGAAGDQNPLYWAETKLEPTEGNSRRIRPLEIQGQILGEEIVRVAETIEATTSRARIRAGQKVITVAGKESSGYPVPERFADSDSVQIRLSVLMINNVVLAGVSGEVLTRIGERLKAESPYAETMMITHANGSSGYLPDDQAYRTPGYEVATARVREGAEEAIVEGLLDLIHGL